MCTKKKKKVFGLMYVSQQYHTCMKPYWYVAEVST